MAGTVWRKVGAVVALVALGACDTIGDPIEAIGGRRPPPDEFRVIARAPLVVPPDVRRGAGLPVPQPGVVSPLEPDPNRDAVEALLGSGGATAVAQQSDAPSEGEELLLASANASAANSDIRVQLEEDRVTAEENQPYEPPTVLELLSGEEDDSPDPAIVLDPIAESQRLQRDGIAAPNDPEAVPARERSGTGFGTGTGAEPLYEPGEPARDPFNTGGAPTAENPATF